MATDRVRVVVSGSSDTPTSWAGKIEFTDPDNERFAITVSGCADNSLMTNFPFLRQFGQVIKFLSITINCLFYFCSFLSTHLNPLPTHYLSTHPLHGLPSRPIVHQAFPFYSQPISSFSQPISLFLTTNFPFTHNQFPSFSQQISLFLTTNLYALLSLSQSGKFSYLALDDKPIKFLNNMEITQRLAHEHARKEEAEAKALMVVNSPDPRDRKV